MPSRTPPASSAATTLARRAWRLLHLDAPASFELSGRALDKARETGDVQGEAWALLARGFHSLYFALPPQAHDELRDAEHRFARLGDRPGQILAGAGIARAMWRGGRVREALDHLLPLRDEGLRLLKNEQRGVLLNAIAGCYSAHGRSEQAFAYMYEALRGAGPTRGHGFDAVLHCNLSHELLQLGDYDEALVQVERGLARCAGLVNSKLVSVLLINRVVCLTELGRAEEALDSVRRVIAMPTDASGRGRNALHFETLAIAALRAGDLEFGADLVARAAASGTVNLADEKVELAVAQALLAGARGDGAAGLVELRRVALLVDGAGDDSASLRVRCLHAEVASELHEALGEFAPSLQAMRRWQRLNAQRARYASRARYQAATLQTELLTLQHQLEENDTKRRATERARAELAAANEQLSRKIVEVEALQAALREQATHDALTGLANRRHLNDTLPSTLALALRERVPLAVAVIDLDRFKAVNDSHGHAAGDHLLAAFGRLLREHLRKSDLAFRYGGEEFCVLMPRTAAADARRKLEELLERWRSSTFELDGVTLLGQSFSAGVADTLGSAPSPAALLNAADGLLLDAKRGGRGRVLLRQEPPAAAR